MCSTSVTVVHIPWGIFRRGTHNPYAVNFLVDLLEDFIIEPLSIVNFRLSDPSPHRARLIPTSYMVKRRRWMFFYDINMLKGSGVVFRIVDRRKGPKPSRYLVEVDGERTWCFLEDLRWLMGRYGRESYSRIKVLYVEPLSEDFPEYLVEYWDEGDLPETWWFDRVVTASKPNGVRHRIVERSLPENVEIVAVYEHEAMKMEAPRGLKNERKEIITAGRVLTYYLNIQCSKVLDVGSTEQVDDEKGM